MSAYDVQAERIARRMTAEARRIADAPMSLAAAAAKRARKNVKRVEVRERQQARQMVALPFERQVGDEVPVC
jgi:hypothetical protein